jgi:hypothetical protein
LAGIKEQETVEKTKVDEGISCCQNSQGRLGDPCHMKTFEGGSQHFFREKIKSIHD